ncbi:MAG: hypothetical protein KDC54_01300, partial [Lewinella sp.]|nr:hypothetical protein [Lewinella sp.]
VVHYLPFWVSRLAVLSMQRPGANEVMVADRLTGAPIPGAQVQTWIGGNRNNQWRPGPTYRTSVQGIVRIDEGDSRRLRLRVQHGSDVLFPRENFYVYNSRSYRRDQSYTVFFLDRGIYRPGQTIHYKALVLRRDTNDISHIRPGEEVTITFYDVNGQEVDKQTQTTNRFGSVSGTFTAPQSRLLGMMSLRSSQSGGTSFRVEEYKRPRFRVEMEPLAGNPRLGDSVTLSGQALAFAGPALQDAQVNYVVERRVRFPWLPYWRRARIYPRNEAPYTLATGQTTTDAEGRFEVTFLAEPDGNVNESDFPIFVYELSVDVVDITGETHHGSKDIRLAKYPLQLSLQAPERHDRQAPLRIDIEANNLDGQAQEVSGQLTIERLAAPEQVFVDRYWPAPDQPILRERAFQRHFPHLAFGEEDQPENWAVAATPLRQSIVTGVQDSLQLDVSDWPAGQYRLRFAVITDAGDTLATTRDLQLFDWAAGAFPAGQLLWTQTDQTTVEPGATLRPGIGTTAGEAFVWVESWNRQGLRQRMWERPAPATRPTITVSEADRGNLSMSILCLRFNRVFQEDLYWTVPWTNKQLNLTFETFRSKLYPDQEEEWRLRIEGPNQEQVAAELAAAMYDASLDQIQPFDWSFSPYPSSVYRPSWQSWMYNAESGRQRSDSWWTIPGSPNISYPAFADRYSPYSFLYSRYRTMVLRSERGEVAPAMAPPPPPAPMAMEEADMAGNAKIAAGIALDDQAESESSEPEAAEAEAAPTKVRTNLSETAFFFPDLLTDEEGRITLKFRSPESLTQWKLQLFAHDEELAYTLEQREVVTQKELMILPNAPRFLRESDELAFTAKVSNLSDKSLSGTATIELFDPVTGADRTAEFGLSEVEQAFTLDPGASAGLAWRLQVPEEAAGVLGYRVLARAGAFADGEEAALPVITNRILVTDTRALFVGSDDNANFRLEGLMNAKEGISHQSLTFELTSNPAWLAIKSLPYLLEYPHECTEQLLNRYYANSLSTHIVSRYPRLREVFESWRRDSAALQSPLLTNPELKSALIEETPWVLDAKDESLQRERIALLFDLDRMATELAVALEKLRQRQEDNGGFAWFPGGNESWYVSQYVVEGLAHLQTLGVDDVSQDPQAAEMLSRAVRYIDEELIRHHRLIEELVEDGYTKWEDDHLDPLVIHYLYVRSMLPDYPYPLPEHMPGIRKYFLDQAEKFWLEKSLQQQAMLALALQREGRAEAARMIFVSLQERALRSEELGMYWKYPRGFYWHQLPIETHALMIELFQTMDASTAELDALRLWLLRNKETNRWETTKATAAAVYALLYTGTDWLTDNEPVQVSFPRANRRYYEARIAAAEASAEAGTGYYQVQWPAEEVRSDLGMVRLRNRNQAPAWGG